MRLNSGSHTLTFVHIQRYPAHIMTSAEESCDYLNLKERRAGRRERKGEKRRRTTSEEPGAGDRAG